MFEINVNSRDGKWQDKVRCGAAFCELGRSRDVILRVRGWRVAPKHIRFEKELAGVFIEDISRGFGVTVNGKSITRYGPLKTEDTIEFGGFIARVTDYSTEQSADQEAVAAPEPASVIAPVTIDEKQARADYMSWAQFTHKQLLKQIDLLRMSLDELPY